ncbi:MAG: DNA polymerase III, subunit gamma and tau [Alphaproteobacteria bacterium CG_4_10_14_0_2_um_filter_63_37]|nr:MAG: DNA polymerase III, subunit gamma and tau [Proteobacteria bacterium CG1_02_64_396]PJA23939.1 MAG: DNA polymerase III, subunit gamma and tau [Alphaproteobacteria bacterium CG_4_10_14_0_2_um_filter_63_37]
MSSNYQVLARKWRPAHFDELVGQEPVVQTLRHAVEQNRIHHAYLFSGVRGVGKTTVARIFARALLCQEGPTTEPCGVCPNCKGVLVGNHLDVLEVDGASQTKVEDMRELLASVHYPPSMGRYKIYIVDEVHMLSNHSFNALLKTLEEPPAHTKFIFATTDPQKIPVTIVSRCQRFELRRIKPEQMQRHLTAILEKEGIEADEGTLVPIVRASEGSLRDALSMLDQAIAFGDGTRVDPESVNDMLGRVGFEAVIELVAHLLKGDIGGSITQFREAYHQGREPLAILDETLEIIHACSLLQASPDLGLELDPSLPDRLAPLLDQASLYDWQMLYQVGTEGRGLLQRSGHPPQSFEMLLMRLSMLPRMSRIETLLKGGEPPTSGGSAGPAVGGAPASGHPTGDRTSSAAAPRETTFKEAAPFGVAPTGGEPIRHDQSVPDAAAPSQPSAPPPAVEPKPRGETAAMPTATVQTPEVQAPTATVATRDPFPVSADTPLVWPTLHRWLNRYRPDIGGLLNTAHAIVGGHAIELLFEPGAFQPARIRRIDAVLQSLLAEQVPGPTWQVTMKARSSQEQSSVREERNARLQAHQTATEAVFASDDRVQQAIEILGGELISIIPIPLQDGEGGSLTAAMNTSTRIH